MEVQMEPFLIEAGEVQMETQVGEKCSVVAIT